MPSFRFVILYVRDPRASAVFYEKLFGRPPVELSDTFAMLPVSDDVMLGLWSAKSVEPKVSGAAGGSEVAFAVSSPAAVDETHGSWRAMGLSVLQPPADMDFGRTFTAADPDGHRIRVYAPAA